MNFVTAGDSGFAEPISWSLSQVQQYYPDASFFVYDWGLEPEHHEELSDADNVTVVDWNEEMDYDVSAVEAIRGKLESWLKGNRYSNFVPGNNLSYHYPALNRRNEYLYSQKPHCILDCVSRIDGDLVFLDGDAVLANGISEVMSMDFDVGVTLRPKEEIHAARERGNFHVLNAGVIYFPCSSEKIEAFVREWIDRMAELDCDLYEQTALTQLIGESSKGIYDDFYNDGSLHLKGYDIDVKILPCDRYNYYKIEEGVNREQNRVLHFKNKRFERFDLREVLDES